MKSTKIICLFAAAAISLPCLGAKKNVTVENTLKADRSQELVELNISKLKLKLKDGEAYQVLDAKGNLLPSQTTHDGLLVFQSGMTGVGKKKFTVTTGAPQKFEPKVEGRYYPERRDDFAWENDRIGFRLYGKSLMEIETPTNGLDLWYKRTPKMILEKFYHNRIVKNVNYHVDHGEGCDAYIVGPSLGAGAMAPYVDGAVVRNANYNDYEVLDNGPLRITFRLTYPDLELNGKTGVADVRTISLDAGSQLTKIVQSYGSDGFDVAAGISKHGEKDEVIVSPNKTYIIYSEPRDRNNGQAYVAVVFPDGFARHETDAYTVKEKQFSHHLAVKPYTAPVTYYTGFGWDKYGFPTADTFRIYTENFVAAANNPFKIKY